MVVASRLRRDYPAIFGFGVGVHPEEIHPHPEPTASKEYKENDFECKG